MELSEKNLRRALESGKIPVDENRILLLKTGLNSIGRQYRLLKVAAQKSTLNKLLSDLSDVQKSAAKIAKIFESDLSSIGEIEIILMHFGFNDVVAFTERLRKLSDAALQAHEVGKLEIRAREGNMKRHLQHPDTWLFLGIHDVYEKLLRRRPGISGQLYRFTIECSHLISTDILVPDTVDAFRKRLTAALERRTGKEAVFPRVIFPWKKQGTIETE